MDDGGQSAMMNLAGKKHTASADNLVSGRFYLP